MSNVLVTCNLIAKESLAILQNTLGFSRNVNRDWEHEFTDNQSRGFSPGQTIQIKRPPRYTYRAGPVAVPQSTVENTIPLTLSQGGCDLNFSSLERTVSLQQFEQKLMAAVSTVVNEIDRQGLDMARRTVFNAVGTPGTLPNSQATALAILTQGQQRLDEMAAPRDRQRHLVVNPAMNASVVQGLAGLFNSQASISRQFSSGMFVEGLGLSVAMDQNVGIQTNGTQAAGTAKVSGAAQSGSTLAVAALTGTLSVGTIFTIANVFAVNPQSRQSTGSLMQFLVTAPASVGDTALNISPAIIPSGAFQNVSASPLDSAAVTLLGAANASYDTSIMYHRDAFTLAMVPMYSPPGGKGVVDVAQMSDEGMTVKATQFYDGINDNYIIRLDVLFGWTATYPQLACKIVA